MILLATDGWKIRIVFTFDQRWHNEIKTLGSAPSSITTSPHEWWFPVGSGIQYLCEDESDWGRV